ncbi:MAG: hypothetical protein AAGK33_03135 [Pseudomonadota bacterium]
MVGLILRRVSACTLGLAVMLGGVVIGSTTAQAASCWNHNGSVMRITATGGGGREIRYLQPRQVLRNAGVRRGTLLFNGFYNGRSYSGTARRFSRFCPGSPQTYGVSGPANNSRIVLRGNRDKNRRCQPTGVRTTDRLVFTFLYPC